MRNNFACASAVHILVIVAGEECAAICVPQILLDRSYAGSAPGFLVRNTSNNVQPRDDSPETVFLTDVVAPRPKALLSTDGHPVRVKQRAEELPSRRNFVANEPLFLRHKIDSSRSGHAACETIDTLILEVRDQLRMVSDHGQAVTWGHER